MKSFAVMELNCNCTRLSVIDMNAVLSFYDLNTQASDTNEVHYNPILDKAKQDDDHPEPRGDRFDIMDSKPSIHSGTYQNSCQDYFAQNSFRCVLENDTRSPCRSHVYAGRSHLIKLEGSGLGSQVLILPHTCEILILETAFLLESPLVCRFLRVFFI